MFVLSKLKNGGCRLAEKIKFLTQQELSKIFKAIERSEGKHKTRDMAIFRIAYRCALRATEIGLILLEDYNRVKGELYCRRLKGSQNNTIRLDQKTMKVLNKYIRDYEKKDGSDVLFLSQEGNAISRKTLDFLMKKYCNEAKIIDVSKHHFHAIKHTSAVHLAESGLDIKDVQWWLGHKNVNNTLIYFQYTTAQQNEMYNKLERRNSLV